MKKKEKNNMSLLKIIYCILKGKDSQKDNEYTTLMFSMLTSSLLMLTGKIMLYMSLFSGIGVIFYAVFDMDWSVSEFVVNIFVLIFLIAIIFASFIFSVLLIGSGREQKNNNKSESVISIFSALISFVALIISLIALFK